MPKNNPGPPKHAGPPEHANNKADYLGSGERYSCPDCGSPVDVEYESGKPLPQNGFFNLIITADEGAALNFVFTCQNCDWRETRTVTIQ